jgi:hypothetical protein
VLIETILGGVTGLLGNLVGAYFKYKDAQIQVDLQKAKFQHELAMVSAETQAMIMESKANIAITRANVEGAIELEDAKAYAISQQEGNKNLLGQDWITKMLAVEGKYAKPLAVGAAVIIATAFGFADWLKGILRPGLTLYLTGVSTWVTYKAYEILTANQAVLGTAQSVAIFSNAVDVVTYLTVSCVTWWFGDRRLSKRYAEMKGGADRTKIDDEIKIE